jgi:hypothetical protein
MLHVHAAIVADFVTFCKTKYMLFICMFDTFLVVSSQSTIVLFLSLPLLLDNCMQKNLAKWNKQAGDEPGSKGKCIYFACLPAVANLTRNQSVSSMMSWEGCQPC